MNIYEVLKRPVITEKSTLLADLYGQYVFEVDRRANKHQVKEAVEKLFGVDVVDVRVINVPAKRGRFGRRNVVRKPAWRKAIVILAEGQRLDIFERVS